MSELIRSAILAGIAVGTAGFGNLAVGGLIGAILFSFGLLTVLSYKLKLYTGTAGFFVRGEFWDLILILLGNIIGCFIVGLLARVSPLGLPETAQKILEGRLATGPVRCGLLGIGCGLIMTTAITFARQGNVLLLLLGIPLFIYCGFTHCIADAFYYLTVPFGFLADHWKEVLAVYLCIVVGNFIGCNLYRIFFPEKTLKQS